jgi:hypothetical protein
MKQEGRHLDTTEVMEAESQAVLNALTEMAEMLGTLDMR